MRAPGLASLLSRPFEQIEILGSAASSFPTTRAKVRRTAHAFAAQGAHTEIRSPGHYS